MNNKAQIIIEIQEQWLKAVCGFNASAGFLISSTHVQSIKGFSDEDITKDLIRFFSKSKIKSERADITIVLPRHEVVVRYLLLPSHADEEIRQMVDLQIFKHIPYMKGEAIIDHLIIAKEPTGYAKVMVFAVELEVVLRLWHICRSAGAWVSRMTVSSLGMVFWLSQIPASVLGSADTEACLILDHDSTEICVSSARKVVFSRSFRIGEKDLESQRLEEWMQQVELSFRQYRSEQFLEFPKRFLVIAGEPLSVMIQESLKQVYKVPVEASIDHLDVFVRQGLKVPGLVPYLVSVCGAAMRGEMPALNLIPVEARLAKLNKDRRLQWIKIVVFGVLLLCAAFFALNAVTVKRNWYLAQLNGEVKKTQLRINALQPKVQIIESIDRYLNGRLILADILSELSRLLPSATSLTMISVNNGRSIVMQGMSKRASEVSLFQKALLNSGNFGDVTLNYTNKAMTVQGEASVFQVTCQMTRKKR